MQQYNSYPFWAARFWHGMRLGDWLALAGEARWRIHWTRWPLALGVFNFAAFNSAASWLQTLLKARAIERADWGQPPLFVVGHWRSGTTHLHDLLHLDPELACPTTYQCFLPHHFLITEWLLARLLWFLVPAKRPMDNVVAGWGRPQEDEFALCNLGQRSPYRWLAFPGDGPSDLEYLDFAGLEPSTLAPWGDALQQFARSLALKHPGRRLVFKSPTHTGRIAHLAKLFPGARFLHLTRHPIRLFTSTVRLWSALVATQSMQHPGVAPDFEEHVLACFERMYAAFETQRSELSEGQLVEIKYESLIENPIEELGRAYEQLDLGDFQRVRSTVEHYLEQRREYRPNEHAPIDASLETEIRERWAGYFERYGYQ